MYRAACAIGPFTVPHGVRLQYVDTLAILRIRLQRDPSTALACTGHMFQWQLLPSSWVETTQQMRLLPHMKKTPLTGTRNKVPCSFLSAARAGKI